MLPCSRLCRIFVSGPLSSASCEKVWGVNVSDARRVLRTHEESWRGAAGVEAAFETRDANAFVFFSFRGGIFEVSYGFGCGCGCILHITNLLWLRRGSQPVCSKRKDKQQQFLELKKKKFTAVSTTTKNTQRYYCAMFSYPRLGKK